jgi:NAD(P)H-dependent FMN reductase
MIKIKIIAGSTRPGRFNIQPAEWIHNLAKERKDVEVELLDLNKISLPFLDESSPALLGRYENEHTKEWAATIGEADGFIFVTPEYNHSYSPAIKNAIDYLNAEWKYKPVSFVSYGSAAGGSRAVEHLRGVAGELRMFDLREQILLPNYWESMNEKGEYQFSDVHKDSAKLILDELSFWAKEMKESRTKL